MRKQWGVLAIAASVLLMLMALPAGSSGRSQVQLSKGQTLYVAVYSHIYWGKKARTYNLACTLSVRNTDMSDPIKLTAVEYYDTNGKKLKALLAKPVPIAPLGTKEFYIPEEDTLGGSGANFIVRWEADKPINAPLVEAVMIGVEAAQGISFTSQGFVISERK